jgi:hypothetical protein
MTESTVKQLASTAAPVLPLVQNWTHELHAMNDNEEPDPPPALAARIPREIPLTVVDGRALEMAAA